jgi:ribosome-binding factor A
MSRPQKSSRRAPSRGASRGSSRGYPRAVRLGESLREVIADELIRIDDERLAFVTITRVDVDSEMNRGVVYFDSLNGEDGDDAIVEALDEHRIRLQGAVGRQIRAKKTPILSFRVDDVIRSAERIDKILRENPSPARHDDES